MPFDPQKRQNWIASRPGFWRVVWAAQDRLGIPRRRDVSAHEPLPPAFAPWMRERVRRRSAHPELFADGDRGNGFYNDVAWGIVDRVRGRYGLDPHATCPPEAIPSTVDAIYGVVDWARWHESLGIEPWAFYREALAILERFGLAPADDGFVASCVYDGIEFHLRGGPAHTSLLPVIQFAEKGLRAVSGSKTGLWEHHFEADRIYVDVTDAVDLVEEIKTVLPVIARCRARLGAAPPRQPGPGKPSLAVHAAYAELLKYEEPDRTWKRVAAMVNARCGTAYEGADLSRLVRREARRAARYEGTETGVDDIPTG